VAFIRTDALTELRAQLRALVDDLAAQGRPEVTVAGDGEVSIDWLVLRPHALERVERHTAGQYDI
jgi:hypothetical protein